jgi:hypothetical protein
MEEFWIYKISHWEIFKINTNRGGFGHILEEDSLNLSGQCATLTFLLTRIKRRYLCQNVVMKNVNVKTVLVIPVSVHKFLIHLTNVAY